jgi:hypothetical protein
MVIVNYPLLVAFSHTTQLPDPQSGDKSDSLSQPTVISQGGNETADTSQVRFEEQRSRLSPDEWDPGASPYTYAPFSTDCTSSDIEKYLAKSIIGDEDSSPFAVEFGALLACGSRAAPYLIQILSTGDDHARFNATIALGEMGAVANGIVVPALIDTIKNDSNPLIRATAIETLPLISPPTEKVVSAISAAKSDSVIVPGSDKNPRGELLPVSDFANSTLDDRFNSDRKPEYRDASCPIKYIVWEGYSTEFIAYYRLDRNSGQCVLEGTDRPPATGGSFLISSFCSLFKCQKK